MLNVSWFEVNKLRRKIGETIFVPANIREFHEY